MPSGESNATPPPPDVYNGPQYLYNPSQGSESEQEGSGGDQGSSDAEDSGSQQGSDVQGSNDSGVSSEVSGEVQGVSAERAHSFFDVILNFFF
jgi:hypothetical protein